MPNVTPASRARRRARSLAAALLAGPALARAQSAAPAPAAPAADPPAVLVACWVPASGTVYRVDPSGQTAGLARACASPAHRQFEWNREGPAGPAGPKGDPGPPGDGAALPTFGADLYDLSGPTAASGGFVARGGAGGRAAVPSGPGTRFLWHAAKAALRAGTAAGGEWDDASIGPHSVAFGEGTVARGARSAAFGANSEARGDASFAAGKGVVASGDRSVALGYQASTGGRAGTFVFGDGSTDAVVTPARENQFVVRAAGGVRLRTSADLAKGCDVDAEGTLSCSGGVAVGPAVISVESPPVVIGPASSAGRRLDCPAGYVLSGGGVSATGVQVIEDGDPKVRSSAPIGPASWFARVRNDHISEDVVMRVRIICIRQ
jgi:hypothetical protein